MPQLKFRADVRSLVFLFAWFVLEAGLWTQGFHWALFLLVCALALALGPIAHNHSHGGTWRSKRANEIHNWLITIAYGYPIFVWVPTHLQNHHIYGNRPGDETATWRYTDRNKTWMALIYFPVSAYYQGRLVNALIASYWQKNRRKFIAVANEYLVWITVIATALIVDWRAALLFLGVPYFISLWSVHFFNYVQHVGCDWEGKYNQSRNFTGPYLNYWLFNNGYHTVHHLKAGAHWSSSKERHDAIADQIHPALNHPNVWVYLFLAYVLSPFIGPEPLIDFRGHPGSVQTLPKAPAPRDDWSLADSGKGS